MSELYHTLVPWAFGIALGIGSILIICLWLAYGIAFALNIPRVTTSGDNVTIGDILVATVILILATFSISVIAAVLAPLSIPIMVIMVVAGLTRLYIEVT